jgi:hypothetical protein
LHTQDVIDMFKAYQEAADLVENTKRQQITKQKRAEAKQAAALRKKSLTAQQTTSDSKKRKKKRVNTFGQMDAAMESQFNNVEISFQDQLKMQLAARKAKFNYLH